MRFFCAASLALVLATSASAGSAIAEFPRGTFSIGGQAGIVYMTMGDVNDILASRNAAEGTRFDDLKRGWEALGDVRYAATDRLFVGLEAGRIAGASDDPTEGGRVEVSGTQVAALFGGGFGDRSDVVFRLFGELGVLASAKLEEVGVDQVKGSAILGSLGGEVEYRIVPAIGLTAQGVVRTARVSRPDNVSYDLDFSGGSLRVGLRAYWGEGSR